MAANHSLIPGDSLSRTLNGKLLFVQVLIGIFLCINTLLITTFFMKDYFYTTMRYILFANTLLSDCLFLFMTNILLILSYFGFTVQIWFCLILYVVLSVHTFVTPLTLTAMTVERYLAICLPLRHGELCSTRKALHCILMIHSISSVPVVIVLSIFFASAAYSLFTQDIICSVEIFILHRWQAHIRSAISEFYFLLMGIVIVFSYVKIVKVVRAASGESKKSTRKGLRTVLLHIFQLLLSLIQMWCPFIEAAVLQIDFMLYINVRYFNYVTFILAPRCLSPLIYGIRDEMFLQALKYYALCALYKRKSFE